MSSHLTHLDKIFYSTKCHSMNEAIGNHMAKPQPRGRPPIGRKTVNQVGLDDEPQRFVEKTAESERKSTSAVIRELVDEAIMRRRKRA